MKRLLLMLAAPLIMADAPPPVARQWLLERSLAPGQRVQLELVRASVEVVERPGPVRIEIRSAAPAADLVRFEVEQDSSALRVRDVYPASRSVSPDECGPPVGQRGAFWSFQVPLGVRLYLPPGTQTDIRLMETLVEADR